MAVIANATTPFDCPPPDTVGVPIAQILPVNPMAWGFTEKAEMNLIIEGLGPPLYIGAALQAEGSYMEKRKGQIWPR